MSVFRDAALAYAARGWYVFPCQPRSKVPATPNGFKDATRDPAQIRAWWDEDPAYNVAVATGEISGIFVLDVDHKQGRTVEEAVDALPALPDAPTVRTGGGGLQFFFKYPADKHLTISGGKLGLGIDTRGSGGYVVAPPSLHPHGTTYQWIDSDDIVELPATPEWICSRLERQKSAAVALSAERLSGGRHDTLMTAAALMRGIGLVPDEIRAALQQMVARLDLSDGRVVTEREIASIAQWCGDKSMGLVNIESLTHGTAVAKSLLAGNGGAACELLEEPGVTDPGPFPAELLKVPGIVTEWCDFINATSHRVQPELALAATLTACGALIGRRLQTVTGGRANLYCLGLCETGGGKERARQGVKEVLHAADASDLIGPEDFASESGLVSSLVAQPVQLFQIDEIGKLLAAIANPRAGSHLVGIVSALLKLYSSAGTIYKGKAYADSAKNPVIDQPHVCLYGTAVPDQTWQALGASAVDDGLLARLWVFVANDMKPARQKPKRLQPPMALVTVLKDWMQRRQRGISGAFPTPDTVERDEAAESIFSDLEAEAEAMEEKMKGSPLRKLWTRTAQKADQLSLVYAWSRSPECPRIDLQAATWACRAAQYLTQVVVWNASRHLAASAVESDLKAVLRYLEDAGPEGRTRTEIVRAFQRLGKRGLDEVMTLADYGGRVVCETEQSDGPGRPTTRYVLTRFSAQESFQKEKIPAEG